MAWLLFDLTRNDVRYGKMAREVLGKLCQQVLEHPWRRAPGEALAFSDYDVIGGASGVLRFLVQVDSPEPEVVSAIEVLLDYLVWLAGDDGYGRHRWYLSPESYPPGFEEMYRQAYPEGYFNLGLAHGITGPLAALACAWRAGYRCAGLGEAIGALGTWVIAQACFDDYGINWPNGVLWQAKEGGGGHEYGEPEATRAHFAAGAKAVISVHNKLTRLDRPESGVVTEQQFRAYDRQLERHGMGVNRVMMFSAHQMGTCRMGTCRMGTCRMGTDPKTSVTDAHGQVHGVKGLFVCDGSLFPSASGVNPMLSIMGLCHKAAQYIKTIV